MERSVQVACAQVEPAILDREATLAKLEDVAAEAARAGAELVVFPETFVPVYPSSRWAKAFAGWQDPRAKETFARIAQQSVAVGSPAERRLGAAARELGVWLVTGVNEVEPERPGTIYNTLLFHGPDGALALHHRKLVPTNHERLVWGQGDGRGLTAVETGFGRIGGLICWENYMPLARFALYEAGVELYVASTADDSDAWQATLVHLARESRAFVLAPCHFQRESAYPADFPLRQEIVGAGTIGRGGSAILAPDGSYLAGPLYDEEGILYAELESASLLAERQRFDPAGHYHRPDLLKLGVHPNARAADVAPAPRTAPERLAAASVEPDRPRLDGVEQEVRPGPRVAGEGRPHRVLRLRLDRQRDAQVGQRPAEDDEAGVDERVHSLGVLPPARLVLERLRRVPLRARLAAEDEERRHR